MLTDHTLLMLFTVVLQYLVHLSISTALGRPVKKKKRHSEVSHHESHHSMKTNTTANCNVATATLTKVNIDTYTTIYCWLVSTSILQDHLRMIKLCHR